MICFQTKIKHVTQLCSYFSKKRKKKKLEHVLCKFQFNRLHNDDETSTKSYLLVNNMYHRGYASRLQVMVKYHNLYLRAILNS